MKATPTERHQTLPKEYDNALREYQGDPRGTAPGATSTTSEQKAALIKGVSDLLFEILGKPQNSTVEMENWGVGGLMVQEYRKQIAGDGETIKIGW